MAMNKYRQLNHFFVFILSTCISLPILAQDGSVGETKTVAEVDDQGMINTSSTGSGYAPNPASTDGSADSPEGDESSPDPATKVASSAVPVPDVPGNEGEAKSKDSNVGDIIKEAGKEGSFDNYIQGSITPASTISPSALRRVAEFPGGTLFTTCQRMLAKDTSWTSIREQEHLSASFANSWIDLYSKYSSDLEDSVDDPEKLDRRLAKFVYVLADHNEMVKKCAAVVYLTKDVDYSDAEYTHKNTHGSFDGKIKCATMGAETQDYGACKGMADAYSAAMVGEKAVQTYQEIDFMSTTMDAQIDNMKDPNDPKNALRAQHKTVKKQEEISNVRGGVSGAKATALIVAIGQMPSREDFVTSCQQKMNQQIIEKYDKVGNAARAWVLTVTDNYNKKAATKGKGQQSFKFERVTKAMHETQIGPVTAEPGKIGAGDGSPNKGGDSKGAEHPCEVGYSGELQLVLNEKAKDEATRLAVEAGLETAANFAKAAILHSQAKKIQNAMNGIDNFKPEESIYGDPELLATECQINPNQQKCIDAGLSRGQDFYDGAIVVNPGGSATGSGQYNDPENGSGSSATSGGIQNRSASVSAGAFFDDPVNKGSGFADNTPTAAMIKPAQGGGGAGGGKGGAASGIGAPGGGDSSGGGGNDGANSEGTGKASAASYSPGTYTRYSGGVPIGNKKSGTSANPFANLLGGKKLSGQNLNFRNPASGQIGAKGKNIFDVISNRYDEVNKSKRLVEYQWEKN